jgi:hypothetical protein
MLMLGAASVGLALVASACQANSIDPTEQFFSINITNDTRHTIVLRYCADDSCRSFGDTWSVGAGETTDTNISDREIFDRYTVNTKVVRLLGCLPLKFSHAYKDVLVLVSQMVPCPDQTPLIVRHGKATGQDTFP